jgi:hypothetical protein
MHGNHGTESNEAFPDMPSINFEEALEEIFFRIRVSG